MTVPPRREHTQIASFAKATTRSHKLWCNVGVSFSSLSLGSHRGTDPQLHPLYSVLDATDHRLNGFDPSVRVWPTGFDKLDEVLHGGFRSGSLALLAGQQGLGKTTLAMQIARNAAIAGRSVIYFSYEHNPESLLQKLVALEIGELLDYDAAKLQDVRRAFEANDGTGGAIRDRMAMISGGSEGLRKVQEYSHQLHLHRSTGRTTTLGVIANAVAEVSRRTAEPPLVVVDYLQKVRVASQENMTEDEKVTVVVEELKDLAIDSECPVLSLVASDKDGLGTGQRMRAVHMRGSTALAYEADTLMILNAKHNIVARHHLTFDLGALERFREWVILSVEKNRMGRDGVDLEFRKRFEHSRFDPYGNFVAETLVDERVVQE